MTKPRGMVYALYDNRVVSMDYIADPKDRFKLAAMRIVDNGFDGFVVDDRRRVYAVTPANKTAKICDAETTARILLGFDLPE